MSFQFLELTIDELEDYYCQLVAKNAPHFPISRQRLDSQKKNPNVDKDDIVMLVALSGDDMVSYRGLLPDKFNDGEKFVWLSTVWTHPEFRRRGLVVRMNEIIAEIWDNKLCSTDFVPEMPGVHEKSIKNFVYHRIEGRRFYISPVIGRIITSKFPRLKMMNFVFQGLDEMLNLLSRKQNVRLDATFSVRPINLNSDNDINALNNIQSHSKLCGKNYWQWVMANQWIQQGLKNDKYYFSDYENVFYHAFEIIEIGNEIVGGVYYLIRNDHLKIKNVYCGSDGAEPLSAYILRLVNRHKVSYLSIYHEELEILLMRRLKRWYDKDIVQNVMLSGIISIDTHYINQSGIGDALFT